MSIELCEYRPKREVWIVNELNEEVHCSTRSLHMIGTGANRFYLDDAIYWKLAAKRIKKHKVPTRVCAPISLTILSVQRTWITAGESVLNGTTFTITQESLDLAMSQEMKDALTR